MSNETQSHSISFTGMIKALLTVALAMCLVSTAAIWVGERLMQSASAAAPSVESPSNNTPEPDTESSLSPSTSLATPEPTVPVTHPVTPTVPTTPPVDEPIVESTTESTNPLSYTIQEGDTLSGIARAYGLTVEELIEANNVTNPDLLYVGWTLVIPDGSPGATTSPQEPAPLTPTEVPDQPTPIPAPASPEGIDEERWIDVDLSDQRLTAYEGDTPVHSFLVSSGLPATPTPVGQFRIWIKLRYDDMAGADYYIEDVPFVMYFHEGYGLHGVTWHGNFGHPMSHGCVNLPTEEAEWLFGFADVGTLVNIHE
jgi:lipoprotein-anchoring transpeptidase ErfK/SrfK